MGQKGIRASDTLKTDIATTIAQVIVDPQQQAEALIRWTDGVTVDRDNPIVELVAAELGLTSDQVDDAWPDILKI